MTELHDLCTDLQAIWYQQIPLSKAMDMRIVDFADNTLTCCASLAPNVNVHGTAFAGSLYAVQALTGWGMMHLQLQELILMIMTLMKKYQLLQIFY